ncbi:MAG: 3D domain-containing protein [Vulcanimicrobiaceae bacterium]
MSVLTLGLVTAGFASHPSSAVAAALAVHPVQHVISFESNGTISRNATTASTVGEFLQQRGIIVGKNDYVHPGVDQPLTENLSIEYHAAVPVRLITAQGTKTVMTAAEDIGALLEEQGIYVDKNDEVHPSLANRIEPNSTIRVVHVTQWLSTEKHTIAAQTIHKIDLALPAGKTKIVKAGKPGERDMMVRYTRRNGTIEKHIIASRIVRKPEARIIAQGIGEWAAFAQLAKRGLEKTSYIASSALDMIATAYTAGCIGCSGYTSSGYRAGHGIVAVDPRVIPLGTKLFIPGYGVAVAGDTGGAIHGRRIDLGFNSIADAVRFGRRTITVYTLK